MERTEPGPEGTTTAQPVLATPRLRLRPFTAADAADVQRLAGDPGISATTLHIPHPYERAMAVEWISTHAKKYADGTHVIYAVTSTGGGRLLGAVGLTIDRRNRRAEMGYWIGREYWNRGYATEAAGAVLRYAFGTLGMNKIFAHHMTRNPASGRVLKNLGMKHEGCLRQHVVKSGVPEDIDVYAMVREEYDARNRPTRAHPPQGRVFSGPPGRK